MSQNKKTFKTPGKIGLFMVVNVVILFFLIVGFGREYVGNLQIEREIARLEAERAELEAEQLETIELIDDLSSEYALERQARTKFGLGESGETLIVVQDPEIDDETSSSAGDEYLTESTNLMRWYYYFFDQATFDKIKAL